MIFGIRVSSSGLNIFSNGITIGFGGLIISNIEYKHHFMALMLSYGTDLSSCGLNRLFDGIKIVSCDLDMFVCCLNLIYGLILLSHSHNQHVTSEALQ